MGALHVLLDIAAPQLTAGAADEETNAASGGTDFTGLEVMLVAGEQHFDTAIVKSENQWRSCSKLAGCSGPAVNIG